MPGLPWRAAADVGLGLGPVGDRDGADDLGVRRGLGEGGLDGLVLLLLAGGAGLALAVEDLGLAAELLVDAVAELLTHGGALGDVVDGGERDAGLQAVEAVVGRGAVEDQRDLLLERGLHERCGGGRRDHDRPRAVHATRLDDAGEVGDLLLGVHVGVLDDDVVPLALAVARDALREPLHGRDGQADGREGDGLAGAAAVAATGVARATVSTGGAPAARGEGEEAAHGDGGERHPTGLGGVEHRDSWSRGSRGTACAVAHTKHPAHGGPGTPNAVMPGIDGCAFRVPRGRT